MILLASNYHKDYSFDKETQSRYRLWDDEQVAIYNSVLTKDKKECVVLELFSYHGSDFDVYRPKRYDSDGKKITTIRASVYIPVKGILSKRKIMDDIDCIVVYGGNTFEISYCMHQNGWYDYIKDAVQNRKVNYIGYSAGAIMATPTVLTAQWADPMKDIYVSEKEYIEGFGFVPFCLKPHSDSYLPNYYQYFKAFTMLSGLDMNCIYEHGMVLFDETTQKVEEMFGTSVIYSTP